MLRDGGFTLRGENFSLAAADAADVSETAKCRAQPAFCYATSDSNSAIQRFALATSESVSPALGLGANRPMPAARAVSGVEGIGGGEGVETSVLRLKGF
jgi:hypothetical protein